MTIVVSGASGFIGAAVTERLCSRSRRVIAIVGKTQRNRSLPSGVENWPADEHCSDRLRELGASGPVSLVHCAGLYSLEHSAEQLKSLVDSNMLFGASLVEALSSTRGHFVNLSSYFQNQITPSGAAHSLYAITKHAFSEMVKWFYEFTSIDVTDLTLYDTYGPNDTRPKLIPSLLAAAKSGRRIDITNRQVQLSLSYVDDIVDAIEYVVASRVTGFWSLRTPTQVSIEDVVATIESVTGCKVVDKWINGQSRRFIEPHSTPVLPGWRPKVSLSQGIKTIWTSDENK